MLFQVYPIFYKIEMTVRKKCDKQKNLLERVETFKEVKRKKDSV